MVLTVEQLTLRVKTRTLVENLSFHLRAGEVLQLVGMNGIGKSTLLRALAGLHSPSSGHIHLKPGVDLLYHPQPAPLFLDLRTQDQLEFWIALEGPSRTCLDQAVEAFGLQPLLCKQIKDLSSGEQQRVALSRLVINTCSLWLLDEPCSFLDNGFCRVLHQRIANHTGRGGVAVVATHAPWPCWPALVLESSDNGSLEAPQWVA
ncbi:MAG: heme ABC exporter ATP-binding protein CcmA [Holosporales bacterium]